MSTRQLIKWSLRFSITTLFSKRWVGSGKRRTADSRLCTIYIILALSFFLLPFLDNSTFAQNVSFNASVDKTEVGLDDQITLTISVSGNVTSIPQPELPSLEGFTVYSAGRSENFTYSDGRISSSVTFNYILVPRKIGQFTIGQAEIALDGKTYKTNPINITVTAGAKPKSAPAPSSKESAQKTELQVKDLLDLSGAFSDLLGTNAAVPPNTITFENRSGKLALVKLIGPTTLAIEVPHQESRTVKAAAGEYYILVRYAVKPKKYTYSRGEHFTVRETPDQFSAITITLHPVVGGNYTTYPATAEEFEKAPGALRTETTIGKKPTTALKVYTTPFPLKIYVSRRNEEQVFDSTNNADGLQYQRILHQVFDSVNYVGESPLEIPDREKILYIGVEKIADEHDRAIGTMLYEHTTTPGQQLFLGVKEGPIICTRLSFLIDEQVVEALTPSCDPLLVEIIPEDLQAKSKKFVNPYVFDGNRSIEFVVANWTVTGVRKVYGSEYFRDRKEITVSFGREHEFNDSSKAVPRE